jgi:glycosyltransferase involved in cell wall biosynthesis
VRILHLIHDHPAHPTIGGGGAVRVHEIATRLAKRGHHVHIVSGWFKGCEKYSEACSDYQLSFIGSQRHPACKAIEYAIAAWKQLPTLAENAEIIIEDFSPYAPVGAYRLEDPQKNVFLQIQNYTGSEFCTRHGWFAGLPLRILEQYYPRRFRNHILVGEHLRSRFQARQRSTVIPMGYSPATFSLDSAPASRGYIAVLGRLDFHQKGLDLLLDALAGTTLPVRFAGTGRESSRLEAALADLPACRFEGRLDGDAKWRFLAGARFLVMPSRFEGQPIVAVEAAAAGTPVLAAPIPELNFVSENNFGRQFASFDTAHLHDSMTEMWNDISALKTYSEAGLRFATHRTWDEISSQFEQELLRISRNS